MPYYLPDLDQETRNIMVGEFDGDVGTDTLLLSAVVDDARTADYISAQRKAFESGDPDSLAAEIATSGMLSPTQANGSRVNVAQASSRLANGQFMAYYIRAVAYRAVAEGRSVEVYRARESTKPRPESEAKIGMALDPAELLTDLREHSLKPWEFEILPEVSSGLSIKLV